MAAKLSNKTKVCYHGNISEQVTKVTQTKINYDQFQTQYASRLLQPIYGRNLSGCEKAFKKIHLFSSILWAFLTIYLFVALMKITMCLSIQMRAILCHVIATTKAQLLDFKLGQKLFQFQRNKIFKKFQAKFQESLNMISE